MSESGTLRTIRTDIPARLDRLPWSRFHWRIVIGLGTVWILDGLEVTIVGSVASRMTQSGSGIHMSSADIGTAAGIYVAGACVGALVFGQLTDRFGRKRLFIVTLGLYVVATLATAFAFAPWYFFLVRFFTGAGIGGEYAAINSAIDELIPARNRGQVDLTINGSYWVGAALGGLGSLVLLNTSWFSLHIGWRIAFGIGGILGVGIMIVRRNVPESPRWLFIHGREQEAELIVDRIESEVRAETRQDLRPPQGTIAVRQRRVIPFWEIARGAMRRYPRRAVLGLSLFVGQAFLYNAVTFNLGTLLSGYFGVGSGQVPYFMVIFAVSNFLGPLLLGRLFDTVGRKPMIMATYFGSAIVTAILAALLMNNNLTDWSFFALVLVTFFIASAGASSAYLTVSEVFPMESRALCIALFFATGTAIGGITGPLLFGRFINSGSRNLVAVGFLIGAGAMLLGGVAEMFFGVRSEQQSLENIARPLTAEEAEAESERREPAPQPDLGVRSARIAERKVRQSQRERAGGRRYAPGVGSSFYSPGLAGTGGQNSRTAAMADEAEDREIEEVSDALRTNGTMDRAALEKVVNGKSWGPGRFHKALDEAVFESRAQRTSAHSYSPPERGTDD